VNELNRGVVTMFTAIGTLGVTSTAPTSAAPLPAVAKSCDLAAGASRLFAPAQRGRAKMVSNAIARMLRSGASDTVIGRKLASALANCSTT